MAISWSERPGAAAYNDTAIYSDAPTGNYENQAYLGIGESNAAASIQRTLIRFAGLGTIPDNAVVSGGTLTVTWRNDLATNAGTLCVYRQKRAWVGTQATYNIYSTGNNWQTAGGFGANDCEQTEIGSATYTATQTLNQAFNIPLNALAITQMISGEFADQGFLLKSVAETNDGYLIYSANDATEAYRPILTLTYDFPSGGCAFTCVL